jgi:hypothetical protein
MGEKIKTKGMRENDKYRNKEHGEGKEDYIKYSPYFSPEKRDLFFLLLLLLSLFFRW